MFQSSLGFPVNSGALGFVTFSLTFHSVSGVLLHNLGD